MKSSFGNYVVQKALKVAKRETKSKLVETILTHVDKLGERKLINKWKKIVDDSLGGNFNKNHVSNNNNLVNQMPLNNHLVGSNTCNPMFNPNNNLNYSFNVSNDAQKNLMIIPNNNALRSFSGSFLNFNNNNQLTNNPLVFNNNNVNSNYNNNNTNYFYFEG